jgi:hypothetical protein
MGLLNHAKNTPPVPSGSSWEINSFCRSSDSTCSKLRCPSTTIEAIEATPRRLGASAAHTAHGGKRIRKLCMMHRCGNV